MALEVGIVGLPSSGKSTLFHALTGAHATGDVGMAGVPDPRLTKIAGVINPRKVTAAAIRVVEVRGTGPELLGNLRQVDALLVVLDGFSGTRVPEKPSSTTSSASTCRRFPSSSGPVPRTSTTRMAAGVTLRGRITSASCVNRGSGMAAMPTSPLARAPASA